MIAAILLSAAAPTELPNFEFRDAVAGEPGTLTQFGRCSDSKVSGKGSCAATTHRASPARPGFISGVALKAIIATTYQGRLSGIYGTFSGSDFPTIATAFGAKYGEPCKREDRDWQSRGGVKTTNTIITWCFRTGRLRLESHGASLLEGRFIYMDEWQPPAEAPRVDF